MTLTIPAAHLDAIGFDESDSPVQTSAGLPVGFKQWATVLQGSPNTLLALEQSMPALLRALARQYGAKLEPGEVPGWAIDLGGRWWLSWNDDVPMEIFKTPGHGGYPYKDARVVPSLTADMDRLEALAAVIAWLVSR